MIYTRWLRVLYEFYSITTYHQELIELVPSNSLVLDCKELTREGGHCIDHYLSVRFLCLGIALSGLFCTSELDGTLGNRNTVKVSWG